MRNSERITNPVEDLKRLVLMFEAQPHDLMDVPQKYKDYFGYSSLANSLMFKLPEIPKHDCEGITNYMRSHVFNTLDSLIGYVKSQKTDIDKLFAIFCWAALNIKYDTEMFFSGHIKGTSLEEVFETKKSVCEGYALFYREMALRSNIGSNIVIKNYSNFSKAFGFDPLNAPKEVKSDHASAYVSIDGVPFISEPTWAAGHLNSNNQFEWSYRPSLFLIPLYRSLCDHYPCDGAHELLPFDFTFQDFFKSCKVRPDREQLKTESHPFVYNKSSEGYIEQQFSCVAPIEWITHSIYKQEINSKNFVEINGDPISSYSITKKKIPNTSPLRSRFISHIAFPSPGFYKVELYINSYSCLEIYFEIEKKSNKPTPVKYSPNSDANFIPLAPKRSVSTVRHGVALIRFAVSLKRSQCIWNIDKIKGNEGYEKGESLSRKYGQLAILKIPFDDERYENQITITFPSNGRFVVDVFLANDEGSYTGFVKYYFDVQGAVEQDPIPPVRFLFKGREFSPLKISSKGIRVKPSQSTIIVEEEEDHRIEFETPNGKNDKICLNFIKVSSGSIVFPDLLSEDNNNNNVSIYQWNIPDQGYYEMRCFINDKFEFSQYYYYTKSGLREPSKEENELMKELKKITDEDESKVLQRQKERERERLAREKKKAEEEERQRLERIKHQEEEKKRQELNKREQIKQEQIRQEQIRQEQIRQEQIRQEQIKQEQIRQEQIRQEQIRQEQIRQEQIRQEQIRQERIKQQQQQQNQQQSQQQKHNPQPEENVSQDAMEDSKKSSKCCLLI